MNHNQENNQNQLISTNYINFNNDNLKFLEQSDPSFFEKIKNDAFNELKINAQKTFTRKLESSFSGIINQEIEKHLKQYIKKDYYSTKLNPEFEKVLQSKIDNAISDTIDNLFKEYLLSDEFQNRLNLMIKEKTLNYALKLLDENIKEEARKLTI